ncbi:MAG: cation:proton antiporter [Evtepia gabavorous]
MVDFLPTIQDRGGIEVWSDIGVIFLMFGLGLEFSCTSWRRWGSGAFIRRHPGGGHGGVGVLLGLALGWGPMNSLFLGVMLAMSSTMITMKNVEDLGMKEEKFAGLAMGTLVIEDLLAIFAMVVLSTIAVSQSISGWALAQRIGLLVLSLALWLILGIYLVPTLMKKLVGLMNDEVLLVFSLGLCFLMALLAQEIGLSTELGAFLAGSLLAGTVHAERVEHLVTPCKHLFGAVFFVSVGFMVQPAMIAQYIGPILLLSGAAIIGKLLFLTLGGLAAGQPLGVCLPAAAAQTQVGEFSFILAGLGQSLSVTGAFLYPVIVAVSVITTFTTPFLLRLAGPLQRGWSGSCLNGAWRRWTGTVRPGDGRRGRKAGTGPGSSRDMAGPLPCTGSWPWGSSSWGPSSCCPCWGLAGAPVVAGGAADRGGHLPGPGLPPAGYAADEEAVFYSPVAGEGLQPGDPVGAHGPPPGGGGPAGGGPGGDPLPGQPPVDVGGGPAGDLDGHPLGPAGRALPGGGGPVPGQLQRAEAGPALWPGGGGGPPVADPAALCDPLVCPRTGPRGKDPPRPGLGQAGPRERPEGPPGPDPLEHPRGERGPGRGTSWWSWGASGRWRTSASSGPRRALRRRGSW